MRILGYLLMVAGGAWILYVRFTNIDMTETRLFIDNFFSLQLAAGAIVAGLLLVVDRRKK